MALKVSPEQRARIEALSDEVKRQIVSSYQGMLEQSVYHIPSQTIVSIWAMDLCRGGDYITTAEINEVTQSAFMKKSQEEKGGTDHDPLSRYPSL